MHRFRLVYKIQLNNLNFESYWLVDLNFRAPDWSNSNCSAKSIVDLAVTEICAALLFRLLWYICNIVELLAIQSAHLGAKFLCEFRYFALLRVQFSLELLPTRLQFADLFIEKNRL